MNNTTGQTPGITATTPTSGAADLPEALRRSAAADGKTELFNLPGYPLMVRAVDFNRLHAESELRRAALQQRVTALETLRPAWAMGHTSDSVAAQASAAALAQVWCALGAANQTEAMVALRGLQEANATFLIATNA